jgi:fibronectin type 3 domain-containing protein
MTYQMSDNKFAIGYYVVTRDLTHSWDTAKDPLDPKRYNMPDQNFDITLLNVNSAGATVSAFDPISNVTTPLTVVNTTATTLTVKVPACDYPRFLVIQEAQSQQLFQNVKVEKTTAGPRVSFTPNLSGNVKVTWGKSPIRQSGKLTVQRFNHWDPAMLDPVNTWTINGFNHDKSLGNPGEASGYFKISGKVVPSFTERYTFIFQGGGGARPSKVIVNGTEIMSGTAFNMQANLDMTAGTEYNVEVISFYDNYLVSHSQSLNWSSKNQPFGAIPAKSDGTQEIIQTVTKDQPISILLTGMIDGDGVKLEASSGGITLKYPQWDHDVAGVLYANMPIVEPSDTTAPQVPTGFAATAGNGQATLSWNPNTTDADLKQYNIYRGGVFLTSVAKPTTTYIATGLINGTSYSFQITAVDNANNESTKSAAASATPMAPADTTPPAVPTGLTATAGNAQVTLNWNTNNDSDIKSYKIYRGNTLLATVNHPSTTHTVIGLANGTSYSFQITAVDNANNESTKSATASATPTAPADTTPPAVPSGLKPTAGNAQVTLNWNANGESDIKGYKIYRGNTLIATVTHPVTTYTVTGLTNGTSYSFKVSAVDNVNNESAKSATVSTAPVAPADTTPPAVPYGLWATAGNAQVNLNWNANGESDIKAYKIYRSNTLIATVTHPETTYTDTGLANGTSYSFKISAVDNANNESAKSVAVSSVPA